MLQVIFAFTFWDACFLDMVLGSFRAYADPVDSSLFRANALIGTDGLPMVNVVASITSILLLAIAMSKDTVAVLVSPGPIELAFFESERTIIAGPPSEEKGGASEKPPPSLLRWLAMQTFFELNHVTFSAVRSVIVPAQAGIGAVVSFAAAGDAQDIVLNSSAIAFVLELDELMYTHQIKPDCRAKHTEIAAAAVSQARCSMDDGRLAGQTPPPTPLAPTQ